jgi:hypothetical protein
MRYMATALTAMLLTAASIAVFAQAPGAAGERTSLPATASNPCPSKAAMKKPSSTHAHAASHASHPAGAHRPAAPRGDKAASKPKPAEAKTGPC